MREGKLCKGKKGLHEEEVQNKKLARRKGEKRDTQRDEKINIEGSKREEGGVEEGRKIKDRKEGRTT